jgi:hypothetical protein
MVGGQVEDLAWEAATGQKTDSFFPRKEQPRDISALEHIHAHKTGALFLFDQDFTAGKGHTKVVENFRYQIPHWTEVFDKLRQQRRAGGRN